jgi:hypothetical protein
MGQSPTRFFIDGEYHQIIAFGLRSFVSISKSIILADMKPQYLTFLVITACYACSSPNKKSSSANPIKKTVSLKDSTKAVSRLAQIQNSLDSDITTPPYGLKKVKDLIAAIKDVPDSDRDDANIAALDEKTYASLSLDEKFTYNMLNLEVYSQMCDILPERTDEVNRIYGHLPNISGEWDWSDRQVAFFKDNRDSVRVLMKLLIQRDRRVEDDIKYVIVLINANEMIPYLIDIYKNQKNDHYLLTVLMLLMKQNKYPAFTSSVSYQKLYHREADEYSAFLVYNQANAELIIQRATNFYNAFVKK